MAITVAIFATRNPELSPAEFQTKYDEYIPKMNAIVGDEAKPESVTRYYVRRSKADPSKPLSYTASGEDFEYDLVAFLTFPDESVARKFQEKYAENKEKIAAGLSKICQVEKSKLIGVEQAIERTSSLLSFTFPL